MAVYVDSFEHPYGRMLMNHMVADSTKELLSMAEAIGVAAKWIQNKGSNREHFDVCNSKRDAAIRLGAKLITPKQLAMMTGNRKGPNEELKLL